MSLREWVFGRPLRTDEEGNEQIGPLAAIPVVGFDAMASAAYGPEAALTVLLPLAALGSRLIVPITLAIIAVLLAVFFSYRQTIEAYPGGGGSLTVARENLGPLPGLLAACALMIDYVLNVAVAIAASVGVVVSVIPSLLPYSLALCFAILLLLTLANLRGVRSVGALFMLPMYLFVGCLALTIALGVIKSALAGGHALPVIAPPRTAAPVLPRALTPWLLLRAFASGCTALTGIEAVGSSVPIFRPPNVKHARTTLALVVAVLACSLAGIAFLARSYGILATPPAHRGFQSVLSQLVAAVAGRGLFYYVTMSAVFAVLALSANTSFADFPRVCRMLALDNFLPALFTRRGRRLVYSSGIVLLACVSGALLIAFGGITDRLIPLFAIGAFGAFTLSQLGMAVYWKRAGGRGARRAMALNAVGAFVTGAALLVIAISKFSEGAWLALLVVPPLLLAFLRIRSHREATAYQVAVSGPLDLRGVEPPMIVVPIRRLDRPTRAALRFGISLSPHVVAVQVLADEHETHDLSPCWQELVATPALAACRVPPELVVVASEHRELVAPLLRYLRDLGARYPGRRIGVVVPERVGRPWYNALAQPRAAWLELRLRLRGGPRLSVMHAPRHACD